MLVLYRHIVMHILQFNNKILDLYNIILKSFGAILGIFYTNFNKTTN